MARDTVTVACKLPAGLNLGFITVNGSNHRSAVGGFGLTPNVDAEAFDRWLADHAKLPPVAQGLIFSQSRRDDARAAARELSELTHGAEAIDPEKPAAGITPTDEQVKETKKQKADREAREAEAREIEDGEAGKE